MDSKVRMMMWVHGLGLWLEASLHVLCLEASLHVLWLEASLHVLVGICI